MTKNILKLLTAIYLLTSLTFAQYIYNGSIGNFTEASSFAINSLGYIYVTDASENTVIQLDTLGNVIKSIGGYGWDAAAFDEPVDVFAGTLNIYVTDKNNDRIQMFDKDLNFLSQLKGDSGTEERFAYPLGAVIGPQGDLFVLDSDNSRILKYDLNGNFQLEIGGNDAGEFMLSNPKHFDISPYSRLYVVDDEQVLVFDQFGNGQIKIAPTIEIENLTIFNKTVLINNQTEVHFINLLVPSAGFTKVDLFDEPENIVSALSFKGKLYLLTENEIRIYTNNAD